MAKKQLTEFTMHCRCGAAAPIFGLKNARFMAHCPDCGSRVFFSNPILLERLRLGGELCPHHSEQRPCQGEWTTWCPRCRVRAFYYHSEPGQGDERD